MRLGWCGFLTADVSDQHVFQEVGGDGDPIGYIGESVAVSGFDLTALTATRGRFRLAPIALLHRESGDEVMPRMSAPLD